MVVTRCFNYNPINKILTELKSLLKEWKQYEYLSLFSYNHLNFTNANLSRAYGLIKTYKLNPLRIIVSSVGSPRYNLAKFLLEILTIIRT